MARVRGKYGRLPQDLSKPRVELKRKPNTDLTPPSSVDWYSAVPANSWGMLANGPDPTAGQGANYGGCGDCTVAGIGHLVDQVAWYSQNQTPAPVTSVEALAAYEAITGYNPKNGRNDTGAELQQVLQWWTKNGFAGYTPSGYAQINIDDFDLVKTCIDYFGAVYTGFPVWAQAETDFDNNEPWGLPTTRSGGQILGGHCVPVIGYSDALQQVTILTWGVPTPVTYAAFAKYWGTAEGGEGWVAVLPQLLEASGETPSGLDAATANADFQSLTGSTESPFPNVNPTPPTPPVGPDADAADQALYAAIEACVQPFSTLQAAFAAWAADHGFHASGDVPPHVHGH